MGYMTDYQPKCLVMIKGKPLIEYQMQALNNAGIKKVALVTGYKGSCLKEYGMYQFINLQWDKTNMVSSMLQTSSWLHYHDCIVSYSDIIYTQNIVQDLIACPDNIAISYDPSWLSLWSKCFEDPLEDAETFRMNSDGYLSDIGRKPKSIKEIQGQYIGLLKFKKDTWNQIILEKMDIENMSMTEFILKLIDQGIQVKAIKNKDP